MALTPWPGDGIAAHLAWIRDEIGPAGMWLVVTRRRPGEGFGWLHHRSLCTDLVATLTEQTADLDDRSCPNGSLEVHGLAIELARYSSDDVALLQLDYVHLALADPDDPVRRIREVVADRLPALWVDVLAGLVDRHWDGFDQDVIDSLISGWQAARAAEVQSRANIGQHRRWARAGHTILADLAQSTPTSPDMQAGLRQRAGEILDQQQLRPPVGPLRPDAG